MLCTISGRLGFDQLPIRHRDMVRPVPLLRLSHCALVNVAKMNVMLLLNRAQAKWGEGDTRCDGRGGGGQRRRAAAAVLTAPSLGVPSCLLVRQLIGRC